MPAGYILTQAGNKMGLNPSNTNQRAVLLRFANEACREVYAQADVAGLLVEQLFKVNGDQTIAFPEYVGEFRAARSYDTQVPIHVNQMRPRYNVCNWTDMWRNWRIKNKQTLHTSVINQSSLTISVHAVEDPPLEVTIAGSTDFAACASETVVMDAVSKDTVTAFNDITGITKNRYNNYDVLITDIDDREVAQIPNNQLESSYLIIDVSTFPYLNNDGGSRQAHYMEVLYKKRLTTLSIDSDEFPAKGYDDIIVNKMLQLWMEEQNKPDLAQIYDAKASRSLARKHEDENRATEDVIALVPHPHDEIQHKIRPNRPKWFPTARAT